MAETKPTVKTTYPLPVYNYRVTVQSGGDSPVLSFVEVSGLSVQYEPVTYKHGMSYATGSVIVPGMAQPIRIAMRQGIVLDRVYLLEWLKDVYQRPDADSKKRTILIDLCDEAGVTLIRWTVDRAMPIKLEAPTLSVTSNEAAVSTMEWVANGLQMQYMAKA